MKIEIPQLLFQGQSIYRTANVSTASSDSEAWKKVDESQIIVLSATDIGLPENDQIARLMAACGLQPDQYHLISLTDLNPFRFNRLIQSKALKTLFIFGNIPVMPKNVSFQPYRVYHIGKVSMVFASEISHFKDSKADKVQMMPCLENLFQVKLKK